MSDEAKPKEVLILMQPEMALAIRDGRKTYTRRLPKRQPGKHWRQLEPGGFAFCAGETLLCKDRACDCAELVAHRYGKAGAVLVVKETFYRLGRYVKDGVIAGHKDKRGRWIKTRDRWVFKGKKGEASFSFDAPDKKPKRSEVGWHKRPAIFMPKDRARTRREIVDVSLQQLKAMRAGDPEAEGFAASTDCQDNMQDFINLWRRMHGEWDPETWVVVVRFREIK